MDLSNIYLQLTNVIVILTFIMAIVGCVIPVIPGPLMISVVVLIHKLLFPEVLGWTSVSICLIVGVVSQIIDFLASWLGAKKYGATWRGCLGATIGAIIAIVVPPQMVTIFIFPFLFALGFEYFSGQNFDKSLKAGWGAFIGGVLSMVLKIACCFIMIIAFAIDIFKEYF